MKGVEGGLTPVGFTERLWEGQGARERWAGAVGCGLLHGWAGSQRLVVWVVLDAVDL